MDKIELIEDLKKNIIEALNLGDMSPSDISADTQLFGDEGLGLDSVDALELVVMAETKYGISIENKDDAKAIFSTVNTLADFVLSKKQ